MSIVFKIVGEEYIKSIVSLVYELNEERISKSILKTRFNEMVTQNYKCAGIFDGEELVGISGLWFCTRHYSGKSVELDHVYIKSGYRNRGIGRQFMDWIETYCKKNGYRSLELNTYVTNYPSHKFYYNEGMEIWGYHFVKQL